MEGKIAAAGRLVHTGGNLFTRFDIPAQLAQGTYFLTVAGETIVIRHKIIVR